MRIVYLGAGDFGLPTLAALHHAHDVVKVITQPDRPAGRKRAFTATAVAQFSQSRNIDTLKTENANDPVILDELRSLKPDAMVVVAFGQYLRQSLVSIPRHGAMNLHASLLPRWRGASPIHSALLNGDDVTGNTIIRIAQKMDAGAMLGQQQTTIDARETTGELHDRLAAMGPALVLDVLAKLAAGICDEVLQDESQVTLAPKLSRDDAYVDFTQSAKRVRCRIHGLTPWPGVRVMCNEHELLLRRVEQLSDHQHNAAPGTLLDESGLIACLPGAGAVRLLEVQPAGKRTMPWSEFVKGHPIKPGTMLVGRRA
ncbi:MAG: methionyl-tRNA formyltransferase [Phycisphaerales bacterium]